ncbi:MAG TPA: response regulator [Pyrinomonadaceae bacterium]|nr:response regulator [Pyrinomonadaceae bacterium]
MLSGRRKLLLADDSPTVRKVVEMFFEEEGYEVVTVGGGEEALRELEGERPPDVLLADAVMPGPDGYMLCERVKRDARLGGMPVVLLVSRYEPFNEAEARRVGADTVLTKPFQSIRDLVSKVGSLLGGESKHGAEQAQHTGALGLDERGDAPARDASDAPPHAHARAEEPPHASEADAARGFDADAASPYGDLGADDELIEAKPADAFGFGSAVEDAPVAGEHVRESQDAYAQTPHDAHAPREAERFDTQGARPSEDFQGERTAAREYEHARANGHAAAAHASSSFVSPKSYAEENQMPAQPPFEARAASAAAVDDALLDLGQLEPHHAATSAAVEDDDFILDLDDEPPFALDSALGAGGNFGDTPGLNTAPASYDSYAAQDSHAEAPQPDAPSAFAEASHGEQAAPFSEPEVTFSDSDSGPEVSFSEPAESFNESAENSSEPAVPFAASAQTYSEDAHARTSSEYESTFDSVGSHPSSFEQTAHAEPEAVGESNSEFVMQDGPQGFASYVAPQGVGSAPRGFVEPEVVPADVPTPAVVEGEFNDGSVEGDQPKPPAVVEGHTRVEEPVRADQLSPEMIDAVARRVVEMMSDKVVREIAWEVVPDLAELLIRQKLEEDKSS